MRTAVIGGGLAGLACARALADRGRSVVLYDRGRAPGGRMTAKRLEAGLHADLGARAFAARDDRFIVQVRRWVAEGVVARWTPRVVAIQQPGEAMPVLSGLPRYVGTPAMHIPLRAMAESLAGAVDLRAHTTVSNLHRATGGSWVVTTEAGHADSFDAVALATPASAAATLLAEIPHLRSIAMGVPMAPCWAVAARFAQPLPLDFDAANVFIGGRHAHAGVLAWMNRESSKPGRPADETWVVHATEDWSRERVTADPGEVAHAMLHAFFEATGHAATTPLELVAHRWKSAFPVAPLCDGCLFDESLAIGACGDWCMGARVEAAYLSGLAMAARLLGERTDFLAPALAVNKDA